MSCAQWNLAPFALAVWVALAGGAACLAGDDAPAGGRVEHPASQPPIPVASVEPAQDAGSLPPDDFTPLDYAIADACRVLPGETSLRDWSQNVPDRDCTTDAECGDGFCDRGRCAAVRSCGQRYGQRCLDGLAAPRLGLHRHPAYQVCAGICLDGRCRSCQSDAECLTYFQTVFPDHGPWIDLRCRDFNGGPIRRCTHRVDWPSRL